MASDTVPSVIGQGALVLHTAHDTDSEPIVTEISHVAAARLPLHQAH